MEVHSWFYLLSIVFFDISMPLLESMLLSSLLTPVEIGPSNALPGQHRKKERNGTNKKIWHSLGFEPRSFGITADALPNELRCQLAEPEY